MKNIFIILILLLSFSLIADTDFVNYYNQSSNWSSGQIGSGTLQIKEKVSLTQDVVIPTTAEVSITGSGEFNNNGYDFSINGDANNPGENDPRTIYLEKVKKIMAVIIPMLLDD